MKFQKKREKKVLKRKMDGGTFGLKKMHLYFQQHVTLFLCHNLKKKFEVGSLKKVAPQHPVKWHPEEWHLAG
jgi:hypothetical protein